MCISIVPQLDGIIGPDDKDNFDEVDSQVADCEVNVNKNNKTLTYLVGPLGDIK